MRKRNGGVSVVVCTLNRAKALARALDSLIDQTLDADRYELIVVDNGSTDETAAAVEHVRLRAGCSLTYDYLVEPGISCARNRGVERARGEIVAFLDDDAEAMPDWLETAVSALTTSPASAIGGPVLPPDGFLHPRWLPRRLRTHLSLLDLGPRRIQLHYPNYPFGANMVLRRSVFDLVGIFDPAFGRIGNASMATGEETDLFRRLENAGGSIEYVPELKVRHHIPAERVDPNWIREQALWVGRATGQMERSCSLMARPLQAASAALLWSAGGLAAAAAYVTGSDVLETGARCVQQNRLGYLRAILAGRDAASPPR
jgi:glucosyl-dolichyl phosphate glucuronosyltransferase